jgi:hypothetical protein
MWLRSVDSVCQSRVIEPRNCSSLEPSPYWLRGQHRSTTEGGVPRSGRGQRAGQRYGRGIPGTCEVPLFPVRIGPEAPDRRSRSQAAGGDSPSWPSESRVQAGAGRRIHKSPGMGKGKSERLIVPVTLGHSSQEDPGEGRRQRHGRAVEGKHVRYTATGARVHATETDSYAGPTAAVCSC